MTLRDLAFIPRLRRGTARRTDLFLGVAVALWLLFGALPGAAAQVPPPHQHHVIAKSCVDSEVAARASAPGNLHAVLPAAAPTPTHVSAPSEEPGALLDPPPDVSTAAPRVLPTPAAAATQRPAATPIAGPLPPPTPLPAITPLTILTPPRCLVLALVGLGVFTIIYGLQLAIMRRLRQ